MKIEDVHNDCELLKFVSESAENYKPEIVGMDISTKIMFDRSYSQDERIEFMNQMEDEITEVINKHINLVGLGGHGEWIYKKEDDEY